MRKPYWGPDDAEDRIKKRIDANLSGKTTKSPAPDATEPPQVSTTVPPPFWQFQAAVGVAINVPRSLGIRIVASVIPNNIKGYYFFRLEISSLIIVLVNFYWKADRNTYLMLVKMNENNNYRSGSVENPDAGTFACEAASFLSTIIRDPTQLPIA